ncbi:RES domain-containing protein [Rhodobacteraceae bacterium RKSG542]|nr:RES domain-containing protein [Pseudovibrio flavus]
MHYQGLLYRALNPVYAREPLSGEGARRFGGRFNAKGTPALYTSAALTTAIKEANQVGHLQPTTVVAYKADINPLFDGSDRSALAEFDMTPELLAAADWRDRMLLDGIAPTQVFAQRLIGGGYAGLVIPSFVRGAEAHDRNVVLWKWGADLPEQLLLIDDEERLKR